MTKSLTDPRTAYEYFLGKRVSDNHWRSLCRTLTENGMTVNDDNVLFYAKVRKLVPRTPKHLKDVLECYQKAEKFLALNSSKITGEQILELFSKESIKPHPATLSRWFKPVGGFRKTRLYFPEKLTPVLASAFIYKLNQFTQIRSLNIMDKFIKRLQTRASRKGISVSKSQVREVYTQVRSYSRLTHG
jgi:hypothetical protein